MSYGLLGFVWVAAQREGIDRSSTGGKALGFGAIVCETCIQGSRRTIPRQPQAGIVRAKPDERTIPLGATVAILRGYDGHAHHGGDVADLPRITCQRRSRTCLCQHGDGGNPSHSETSETLAPNSGRHSPVEGYTNVLRRLERRN